MKKFLSILLALAVGFTFTFGSAMSAFATTTVDKTPITDAQTAGYKAVDNAATALLDKFSFDKEEYLTGFYSGYNKLDFVYAYNYDEVKDSSSAKSAEDYYGYITKATIQEVIKNEVKVAKNEIQKVATNKYNSATDDDAVKAGVTDVNKTAADESEWILYLFEYSVTTLDDASYDKVACLLDDAFALQAKTDKAAALKELGEYTTTQYSDNVNEWSIKGNETYESKYAVKDVAGVADDATAYSAKAFVEKMLATQIKAVNDASGTDTEKIAAYSNALTIASDIIKGHKITATENYYVAPVPTADDINKDTTLADAKSYAINKMETALAAQIANEKERINAKIAEMEKLAKPDADALAAYKAALAGLDAQAAAAKEVYTAQINAQTKVADVYVKDASNAIIGGQLKTILGAIASLTIGDYDTATDKCPTTALDALVNTTKEVDKAEAYAADLKALVDRNGAPLYDASAINAALEEAVNELYLDSSKTFANYAKNAIATAANIGDSLIAQKATFVKLIEGNKSFVKDNKDYKWTTTKKNYEEAQLDAYKKCVADTEAAILAATTYDEIVAAYINGWKAMDEIITIAEHASDWGTGGKLKVEYDKNYKTDLEAYISYAVSKLDDSKYSKVKDAYDNSSDIENAVKEIVEKAYTKEEIPAQVTAAKAFLDSLKSDDELDAEKKKVEALITALPTNVTLADKDQIIAARDAAVEYNKLPGKEDLLNGTVLNNVVVALAKLEAKAIADQAAELGKDAITTADADAIAALDKAIKDYRTTYEDEIADPKSAVSDVTAAANSLKGYKEDLSDAQIAEVIKLCTNVAVNPTTEAEKAAVKAAREAFNALDITQQAEVIKSAAYDKLSQAEANMEINKLDAEAVKAMLFNTSLKATSKKVTKGIKVTVKVTGADLDKLAENGYTVEYKFYRSTKKASGYKYKTIKTGKVYKNTKSLKKGTKYYYKAKLVVKDADGNEVAATPLKQCTYAARTFK